MTDRHRADEDPDTRPTQAGLEDRLRGDLEGWLGAALPPDRPARTTIRLRGGRGVSPVSAVGLIVILVVAAVGAVAIIGPGRLGGPGGSGIGETSTIGLAGTPAVATGGPSGSGMGSQGGPPVSGSPGADDATPSPTVEPTGTPAPRSPGASAGASPASPAPSAKRTRPPASIGPGPTLQVPPASPAPTAGAGIVASGTVTLTNADSGATVDVAVGTMIVVDLDQSRYWRVTVSDPSILDELLQTTFERMLPRYGAVRPGKAVITGTGELPCAHATPPCLAPAQLFTVTIVVH